MFAPKPLTDLDRQALAAEDIDDRQSSQLLAVAQLIVDEVQAPGLVGTCRTAPRFSMHHHLATTRAFAAKGKTFLTIQAIDRVPTNRQTIALQHDVDATVAVTDTRLHDLMHPLPDRQPRIAGAGLSLRRSVLTRQRTGPAIAVAMTIRHVGDNLFHERRPWNFFDRTSCKTALSRLSSATSFLSRGFSSDVRQLSELPNLIRLQARILLFPAIEGLLRDIDLPDQIRNRKTQVRLFQSRNDLLDLKSLALHRQSPPLEKIRRKS